jgi:hypothetical protein
MMSLSKNIEYKMLIKLIASRLACLLGLAFICSIALANPLKVIEFDKGLLAELPSLQNAKIAFIDLSAKKLGPKIAITNLEGSLLESFSIPSDRYSPEWTNWGPGISYDVKKQAIWFLSPRLGLTEFNLKGEILQKINFPNASHQIQITSEGTFVMPYSWDKEDDFQVSELDTNGRVLFQWMGKDFVNKSAHANSVAHTQPSSYTATTSAVKTSAGNYYLSMSQKNLIIKLNKVGEVIWWQDVATRPHTLVVNDDKLIGYSARLPNRLVLMNDDCHCFKEVVIDEPIRGKAPTRSLSLQYLGKGLWFTSGVTALYILNDEGKIYWKLEHEGLRGRPIGFHAAVLFNN